MSSRFGRRIVGRPSGAGTHGRWIHVARPSTSRAGEDVTAAAPRPSYALGTASPRGSSATVDRTRTSRRSVARRGHEPEQRAIERVDPGRGDPDPSEPEREDRVLAVAGVVVRRAVGGQDRQVRLAAEPVVQRREQVGDRLVGLPGVLQPALPDLGVGAAVDPALPPERLAQALVVAQVAVVAEREAPGRVVERLGVRHGSASTASTAGADGPAPPSSRAPRPARGPGRRGTRGRRGTTRAGRRRRARPRPSRTRRSRTARAARRTARARRAGTAPRPGR